jgi:hypothetical protein
MPPNRPGAGALAAKSIARCRSRPGPQGPPSATREAHNVGFRIVCRATGQHSSPAFARTAQGLSRAGKPGIIERHCPRLCVLRCSVSSMQIADSECVGRRHWGHDLLTDDERVVLRGLAAFRGTFDLEAAEAVVADGETVRAADVLDPIRAPRPALRGVCWARRSRAESRLRCRLKGTSGRNVSRRHGFRAARKSCVTVEGGPGSRLPWARAGRAGRDWR